MIKDKSDDEWWRALLQSRNDHLRQTALRNAHTPVLLATLTEPQERSLVINSPQLAADVRTTRLKEEPSLPLSVEQPDFSLLRDLMKSGATWKVRSEARHRLEGKQRHNAPGASYGIKRIILLR